MFLKRKGLITVQANQLVIGHVNTVDEVRDMWGEGGGVWFNRVIDLRRLIIILENLQVIEVTSVL